MRACVYFNQTEEILLTVGSLKFLDKITYLGRSVSSTKNDIDMQLSKALRAIERLWIIWKVDLFA